MRPSDKRHPSRAHSRAHLGNYILDDVHSYRVNRHSFTIYVGSDPHQEGDWDGGGSEAGVEHHMADRFEFNLSILSGINPRRPILVQMSSCGGMWDEGMQMFGAILMCPNPVTVLGTKWCRSMTSIIPLAADRFVMRPPAKYMYHRGTFSFEGLDQEAETEDLERRKLNEMMMRLYVSRLKSQGIFSDKPERQIRTMLENNIKNKIDVWLTPDEAVEWGFVDGVFDGQLSNLRAKDINAERRAAMMEVLRRPIDITVKVT